MRDLGRPRNDMWEVAVWEDVLATVGREVYLTYQVHNEAIVVPEIIDAIRAMVAGERDPRASIERTDRFLGIVKSYLPRTIPEDAIHAEMGKALQDEEWQYVDEGYKGSEEPTAPEFTQAQRSREEREDR